MGLEMKYRSTILGAIAMGAIGLIAPTDAKADSVGSNPSASPAAPQPRFSRTIDLSNEGRDSWIFLLTFSPDSRYLAVVDNPNLGSSTIIIWDLQLDREQTRIAGLPPFGGNPQVELLWSPDGKYISYGSRNPVLFWDPLTGHVVKELAVAPPVDWSRFNKDGSKLLVNRDILARAGFRIYDTSSWEFHDYGDDGLIIQTLSWTAEDKVLVGGAWPRANVGRALDGMIPQMSDSLVRLIDPSGRDAPRSVLLAPSSLRDYKGIVHSVPFQSYAPDSAIVNYRTNKIAIGFGKIIDGRTMEIFTYASDDDILSGKIPAGGRAFSPDGNYLYLLGLIGIRRADSIKSLVMDARTGLVVASFPGGQNGLAASPDGKHLAVGNGRSIDFYDVQ